MNRRDLLMTSIALPVGISGRSVLADADGFYVPAEERAHEATLMQWPVNRRVHPDSDFLAWTQETIAKIANTIAEFEPVIVLAAKQYHRASRKLLSDRVTLWDIATDDLWCRDSGPIIVVDDQGNRAVRHIQFNGWGNKQIHDNDGRIAERVAARLELPLLSTSLKGEAGGVEQDGHGVLLAHESSWVIDSRNRGLSRDAVGAELLRAYGADRLIWSDGVWDEDITDYHIDSLARFTGPKRVLMNLPDDPDLADSFHKAALKTHDVLVAAGLEVEVIPEPNQRRVESYDFVASYVNYYVCNGGVVAPQFGDEETDAIAVEALRRHYPDREVITLNTDALGEVGGGIHCATQQIPMP